MNTTLSPVEQLALSKLKVSKDARAAVKPGDYQGTVQLEVDYDLRVGEDYEQQQANTVPWMKLATVLFSKLNDTTMESVLREALDENLDVQQVKEQAEKAISEIMGTTLMTHKGKVTVREVIVSGGLNG